VNPATATRRIAILAFIGGLGGGLVFPILPALGLLGFVLAFLNSAWIFYGIWRSGRE